MARLPPLLTSPRRGAGADHTRLRDQCADRGWLVGREIGPLDRSQPVDGNFLFFDLPGLSSEDQHRLKKEIHISSQQKLTYFLTFLERILRQRGERGCCCCCRAAAAATATTAAAAAAAHSRAPSPAATATAAGGGRGRRRLRGGR